AQIPGYDYEGCWTEAPDNVRALNGSSYFDDYMTVEKCADACTGFKYFGVEYGRECYCGNTLDECSIEADDWECSFACPGDSAQNCGAGDRLDLYVKADTPTPTTYGYRGCYAEPSNARALPNLVTASPDMTVDTCATKCGGDWHFNLYEFGLASPAPTTTTTSTAVPEPTGPVTYVSEGCYTEATGIRALSDHAYYNDVMTVALCAEACSDYTYFGVEYGRECFCGNAINTDQGSTLTSLSECSFPCPGNPAEKCGAGNRLNVYRNLPPVEQVTITTTTTAAPEEALTTTSVIEETSTTVAPEDALTTTSVVEETSTTETSTSATLSSTTSATSTEPTSTSTSTSSTTSSTTSTITPPAPTSVL
ncbi:WSC domain-containing protein, partial [Cladorrhinum sp. PSN332]